MPVHICSFCFNILYLSYVSAPFVKYKLMSFLYWLSSLSRTWHVHREWKLEPRWFPNVICQKAMTSHADIFNCNAWSTFAEWIANLKLYESVILDSPVKRIMPFIAVVSWFSDLSSFEFGNTSWNLICFRFFSRFIINPEIMKFHQSG